MVTRGGRTVRIRGQCLQELDGSRDIDSHDPAEQTAWVMGTIRQLIEEAGGTMQHLEVVSTRQGLDQPVAATQDRPLVLDHVHGLDGTPGGSIDGPTEGEDVVEDYRSTGLTLDCHPMSLLHAHLAERRLIDSAPRSARTARPPC